MRYSGGVFRWRNAWYCKVTEDGKRRNLRLADTKAEAQNKLAKLKAQQAEQQAKDATDYPFLLLCDQWCAWMQSRAERGDVSPDFVSTRVPHVKRFLRWSSTKDLYCSDITPAYVREYLAAQRWTAGNERTHLITIKQVMSWGVRQKIIAGHDLTHVEAPRQKSREFTVSPGLHAAIIKAASPRARLFIEALRLTGCRPGELRAVQLRHLAEDYSYFALRKHKTSRKTGKPRTVYLVPEAQAIFRQAIGNRTKPSDYVFIGRNNKPHSTNSIRCLFRRLREKLKTKENLVAYSYRHTFATNALTNGVPIATVAELMGSSVRMIERHYGHLAHRPQHLADAMKLASRQTT